MATETKPPALIYPPGFDARSESEMRVKGYLSDVVVRVGDGKEFVLNFIDPVRLTQDLAEEASFGRPYFAEAGLVVVLEVTKPAIASAVEGLWHEGCFDALKPMRD